MKASYAAGVVFCLVICALSAPRALAAKNILYIFDASGSMLAKMPEGIKIDIARRVLSARVQNLPDSDINVGLVVYGH